MSRVGASPEMSGVNGGGAAPRVAPMALTLRSQADRRLTSAAWQADPVERFTGAYIAGLRAAAAVLAARGRPHRGRARPTSVWTLLSSVAPELSDWAGYFAAQSSTYAAAQAGIGHRVTAAAADDLLHHAGRFLGVVERQLGRSG
ncbi:hypothetical protein H0B56_08945 [Haloechinothrix sp. YIM 98757]|uniref:SAV-6107-like HEPN domain-containing protein n=1 Tax=Haloechinothrix aidingensis TaxID=2752311 RepID=A0A838A333_9PSEU|nr:hypothetical protein [Haloechinothrix aidingensis]